MLQNIPFMIFLHYLCAVMKHFAFILIIAFAMASCSGDGARREAAANLLAQARTMVDNRSYDSAIAVIDTINIKYRDCLEQRRDATLLRLEALSALTRDSIASAELALRAVTESVDSLAPLFRFVDVPGTAGYYVDKNIYSGEEMASSGIQVRVDDQGYCFVVAVVAGRKIGLSRIVCGDVSTPVLQCVDVENSEVMSVTQEPATPLLDALSAISGSATVELAGSKGKVNIKLGEKQLRAIASTWRYSKALQQKRALSIRLEKLERQLAKLSDQLAQQTPLPDE